MDPSRPRTNDVAPGLPLRPWCVDDLDTLVRPVGGEQVKRGALHDLRLFAMTRKVLDDAA